MFSATNAMDEHTSPHEDGSSGPILQMEFQTGHAENQGMEPDIDKILSSIPATIIFSLGSKQDINMLEFRLREELLRDIQSLPEWSQVTSVQIDRDKKSLSIRLKTHEAERKLLRDDERSIGFLKAHLFIQGTFKIWTNRYLVACKGVGGQFLEYQDVNEHKNKWAAQNNVDIYKAYWRTKKKKKQLILAIKSLLDAVWICRHGIVLDLVEIKVV